MNDDKIKETMTKLAESGRLKKIVFIAGIAGIALLLLSSIDFSALLHKERDEEFSVTTYNTKIESDLESVLSKIQGAGKTKVLLTMENSVEYVYLKDSTTKTKEVEPLIRGVLVVCEGGDEPVVVARITEAVTRALDISTAKVCITKLSE